MSDALGTKLEQVKDVCCKCYRDRRIWFMIAGVLSSGLLASVFAFEIDMGSNIIYGFTAFWGLVFFLMGLGFFKAVKNLKKFCAKEKNMRDEELLISAGIVFAIILISSLFIFVHFENNYIYWMEERGLPKTTVTKSTLDDCTIIQSTTIKTGVHFLENKKSRETVKDETIPLGKDPDCEPIIPTPVKELTAEEKANREKFESLNLPDWIKKESKWRKKVETLVSDHERIVEVLKAKAQMDNMTCEELFQYRYVKNGGASYPEDIYNSHKLVEKGCDIQRDYYDKGGIEKNELL